MPYCETCDSFKKKMAMTNVGIWGGNCLKFKIYRNADSYMCEKYKKNDEIEETIIHRPEIKMERDERFE